MQIQYFIRNFRNYPVMFIGTGLSLRYLENSYNWEDLLKKIAFDFESDEKVGKFIKNLSPRG